MSPDIAASEAPSTVVFVSDPSAEAEKVAQALRTAGYVVVDVPMSMLIARVAVQRPRVILVDADTDGALETVARLRDLPDAEGIDVVFLGKEGHALKGTEDALAHEGSGFFGRPVDVAALVRKIETLTGGPPAEEGPRPSTPPPSLPNATGRPAPSMRSGPELPKRHSSRPPPPRSSPPRTLKGPLSTEVAGQPGSPETMRRAVSIQTPLSAELETLLAEAEQRAGTHMIHESGSPTPEEEIEAVLPAEILSSLDEPVDEEEEDELDGMRLGERAQRAQITSTGRAAETSDGGEAVQAKTHEPNAVTTGTRAGGSGMPAASGAFTSSQDELAAVPSAFAGPSTEMGDALHRTGPPPPGQTSGVGSFAGETSAAPVEIARPPGTAPPPADGLSQKAQSVPPPARIPSIIGRNEAPLVLARAIAVRATGALCIEAEDGVRRAVLREGDLVTAASGVESESLLSFLGGRGDVPREVVQQLMGKVPPFGRHAGAALVAHGHLRQDQLWPVLRAHAEWILGRAILVERGAALVEADPPGRLKGEPSVFGGSTGAEVLIEVVRRVIAPDDAVERMGGFGSRIGEGQNQSLLSECALDAAERDLVTRMLGATLSELVYASPEADFASLLYGLVLLGVIEVIRTIGQAQGSGRDSEGRGSVDALDEDAVRARVRARLALVDEGDYFALLGVSPDATGYEVRRAFVELRRAFDPHRILTTEMLDLADDVEKIAGVLEEAYDILRDNARRERYRRAIAAMPEA